MFLGGVLLYQNMKYNKTINAERIKYVLVPCLGFMLCVLIYLLQRMRCVIDQNFRQLLCALVVFPLMIICATKVEIVERVLSIRPIQFLSGISMEVFLWHFPVQLLLVCLINKFNIMADFESLPFYGIYILAVLLVATISNKLMSIVQHIKKE